jgi:hypothetical protein
MKFAALVKKELRICLPWLCLSVLAFVVIGSILMKGLILNQRYYIERGYDNGSQYSWFTPYSPITEFGPLILITSLALGVILAIRQFFLPGLSGTWPFTIHRSIKPQAIVWAKFTAAVLTFLFSIGLFWTLFYSYAAVPGRFYIPIFFKTCLEGWIYICLGLVAYLGTALSAVSTAHFYTTRLLGMAIATMMFFLVIMQTSITGALVGVVVGACILIVQIFHTFLAREY